MNISIKLTKFPNNKFFLLLFVFIYSCATNKLKVAEFDFIYNGDKYTIRSAYCSNDPKSCNQLLGKDFVAVDMNQDRIIDEVTIGEVDIFKVQEIYDYCLEHLEKSGKINEVNKKNNEFIFITYEYKFIIKSFSSVNKPFNQFTIIKLSSGSDNTKFSIYNDKNANGTLNESVKGSILINKAQQMYNRTIEKGLEQEKVQRANGYIIVL